MSGVLEPWPLPRPEPDKPAKPIEQAINDATDQIVAERVVKSLIRERKMSLIGKLAHLSERAQDFHAETEKTLDGIAQKIDTASKKRDDIAARHHDYYDAIIKGVDQSIEVIDRLSNSPLPDDGERSDGV